MPSLTVFYNPTCTKSKLSVACLESNKTDAYDLNVTQYQLNPPSNETLLILSEYLKITKQPASAAPWNCLLRPEAQGKAKSFEAAFATIQVNPVLLERPLSSIGIVNWLFSVVLTSLVLSNWFLNVLLWLRNIL